ncbi:50S ribosomal protein L29 [Patescibacteria group bacterium]|nr:50S ribosomal protein L29 [Patescibacteria group bacterium]MBU1915811.1 50S ribosomal protein L29 [Patescibacteria group bacterium]
MAMKIKELREKSDLELDKLLTELMSQLQDCRFAVAGRRLKRVREMLEARKTIARILTLKKERQSVAGHVEKPTKQVEVLVKTEPVATTNNEVVAKTEA